MINSSSRRLSSNNAPSSRWPTRTRLIPLTLAVLSIVWVAALIVSTSPVAVVNAHPEEFHEEHDNHPTATSTPPTNCPWDPHIADYRCDYPPTATPATPTPPTATQTPTPTDCSISNIALSRSYRSGSWTSSDCYSIRWPPPIFNSNYTDYYTFTLTETTQIRIDLESSLDTYLFLIRGTNPRGSAAILASDDDSGLGEGRYSRIQRTLNRGSYTIAATTFFPRRVGSYKVRVYEVEPTPTPEATSTPTPPSEPTPEATSTPTPPPTATTTPPTATTTPATSATTSASCSTNEIDLSQSYRSGSWTHSDCYSIRREGTHVDYYTFTLAETTPVRIDLESSHDTYLYLIRGADPRSSTGTLESDDDGGHGRNSRIQRTLDPGSYTIAATTLGRDREGSYSVRVYNVDSTPPAPQIPPAHTESCSIDEIDLSRSYTSGSWTPSDCDSMHRDGSYVDYYTFTLTETTQIRIDLDSSVDPHLYLIRGADPWGSTGILASDDDSGHGFNARIRLTLNPGSYTIAATTYSANGEGSYSVRVYDVDSDAPA